LKKIRRDEVKEEIKMSAEENEAIVRQYIE
jgi:hypothetical protein